MCPDQRLAKIASTSYLVTISRSTCGMNSKLHGPKRTAQPAIGDHHVPRLLTIGIDGHPLRMRLGRIVAQAMRIDAGDHRHIQLSATASPDSRTRPYRRATRCGDETERRSDKTRTCRRRRCTPVGVNALEEIEPPIGIERRRVLFHQRQLNPAHGLLKRLGNFLIRRGRGK